MNLKPVFKDSKQGTRTGMPCVCVTSSGKYSIKCFKMVNEHTLIFKKKYFLKQIYTCNMEFSH